MMNIQIAKENIEKVEVYLRADHMNDIDIAIAKRRYEASIKEGNRDEAYKQMMVQKEMIIRSTELHKEKWAFIKQIAPETAIGNWTLDTSTYILKTKDEDDDSGQLLHALARAARKG